MYMYLYVYVHMCVCKEKMEKKLGDINRRGLDRERHIEEKGEQSTMESWYLFF